MKTKCLIKAPESIGGKFTKNMYQGKRNIIRINEYNERRLEIISTKSGAVFTAFTELENLINKSSLAEQYFNKSQGWLSQRINGCTVHKKEKSFKEEEYHQLAEAFRDIAKRLQTHADEIDAAKL